MDKNEFIRRYAAAQRWELSGPAECRQLANHAAPVLPRVERVISCMYPESPHASFAIQQVAVTASLIMIVIDTAVYGEPPSLLPELGERGVVWNWRAPASPR
jgi:hypothetical protein